MKTSVQPVPHEREPVGAGAVDLRFALVVGGEDARGLRLLAGPPEESAVRGSGAAVGGGAADREGVRCHVGEGEGEVQRPGGVGEFGGGDRTAFTEQLGAGGDPAQFLHEAVGVAELERGVALGAVVVQFRGALVTDVGAAAPEVVPLDVGNGDTDAEVVGVVDGAQLGDRRARQGGHGVQIRAWGEPVGQLGPGDVPGDRAARDAQHRRVMGDHQVLTSFGGAQEAPSSE